MDRPVLEASDLAKSFSGSPLFDGLSFRAESGLTAVTGPNGSGKTTLLKILGSLARPSSGRVRILRANVELAGEERRAAVGWAGPDLDFYDDFTALENLVFFRRIAGGRRDDASLRDLLGRIGLMGPDRRVGAFSTGMKQRLRVAFAFLGDPPIVLLDEPYASLDAEGRGRAERLIAEKCSVGAVVVASNDAADFAGAARVISLGAA
ncbi:MAG: ATP-binding cassette domain-containing protein [Thermoanaerobaculia bacterium]